MSTLFVFHLATLISGFVLLTAAFITAVIYGLNQRALKQKRETYLGRFSVFASLEAVDRLALRFLHIGGILLSLGVFSGIYLAHFSWKTQPWVYDKKVLAGMFTWVWYMGVILLRAFRGYRGKAFLGMLAVGYLLLMFSFVVAMVWTQ